MERYTAKIMNVRVPPRKARLAAGLIRNKSVAAAKVQLIGSPMKSSGILIKLLKTAICNALTQGAEREAFLTVQEVCVDSGRTLKRSKSRSRGSSTAVLKRSSHFSIVLSESEALRTAYEENRKAGKKEDTGRGSV